MPKKLQKPRINILMIIVDALRAQNMSVYGYCYNTTPNIAKLKKDSVFFENSFSVTNVTDSSLTTIYTGLYPVNHGIKNHGYKVTIEELKKVSKVKFIQEYLSEKHGYNTFAFDFLERWHKRGFKDYFITYESKALGEFMQKIIQIILQKGILSSKLFRRLRKISLKITKRFNAERITHYVISYLKSELTKTRIRPFFGLIHYWDTHIPYYAPPEISREFSLDFYNYCNYSINDVITGIKKKEAQIYLKSLLEEVGGVKALLGLYDASIRYVDECLGVLIDSLKDIGLYDNTLIILTSDHGESLVEHNIFFDHHGLYNVTVKVPLLIKFPYNIYSGTQIKAFTQHVDIVPTILDLIGDPEGLITNGKSILHIIERSTSTKNALHKVLFFEEYFMERKRAIIFNYSGCEFKYICANSLQDSFCEYCGRIHGGLEELYNLSQDRDENVNLINNTIEPLKTYARILLSNTLKSIIAQYNAKLVKRKLRRYY